MAEDKIKVDDLDILTAIAFLTSKGYDKEITKAIQLGHILGYKIQLSAEELISLLVEFKKF